MFIIVTDKGYFAGYSHLLRPIICKDKMVVYTGLNDAEAQLHNMPGAEVRKVFFGDVRPEDRKDNTLFGEPESEES